MINQLLQMEPASKQKKRYVRKQVLLCDQKKTQEQKLNTKAQQIQNSVKQDYFSPNVSEVAKISSSTKWRLKQPPKNQQLDDCFIQPVKDMIDAISSKRLKKHLSQICKDIYQIMIKYDKRTPSIIFSYYSKGKPTILLLKDLIKANEALRKNKALIKQVYGALYRKVQQNFYEIGFFGLEVAQRQRLLFRDRNFRIKKMASNVDEYLFYYAVKQQKLNFLMFDSILNCVEFSTDNIIKLQKVLPQAFQKYLQLQNVVFKGLKVQSEINENFGQEQVDSDEEGRAKKIAKIKEPTNGEIRSKIAKLLGRDVDQLQEKIDQKDEMVQKYHSSGSDETRKNMEKLADQIMEQQASLDNFIQTRDSVAQKMKMDFANDQQQLKMLKICLKKMILAEKQLSSRLPIISRKRQIFQKLNKTNLLILEGQTGSGKSTQLPQLLCEYYKIFQNDKALPVLITQPRKLATRTLAERVAAQIQERIHGFVDYQTSITTKISEKAKIVFKMDRLVLDELKADQKLSKYCCLVIDEAHERTISIDVILGLIKKLLTLRNDFKIIVTSASMDTQLFRSYFKTEILKVSGRMYPVEQIFEPYEHQKDKTTKIKKLINQKILDQNQRNLRPIYRGHILVFCSGIDQINELTTYFSKKLNPILFKVLALHGKLTPEQQREVFTDTKEYKVIFSTRIAETSITIDKVKVVIDPGEDRQLIYDQKTKVTALKLKNISQSSAKQRAGRAGRTNQGFCFRLYSKKAKAELSPNKTPEIQNMALDTVVLRLKSLNIDNIIDFPYVSPPSKEGLTNSIQLMKMLNCLDSENDKITTIGEFLVKIPIQPFLARAIVEAMLLEKVLRNKKNIFQVLKMKQEQIQLLDSIDLTEEVIRILCLVVNASNIFYVRPEQRQLAERIKFQKLADQDGDFFFLQNIYKKYLQFYRNREVKQMKDWAYKHFLSLKTLHQVQQLQKQITQIIKYFSIDSEHLEKELLEAQVKIKQAKSVRQAILSCLVSSFATNLALYSQNQHIGYTVVNLQIPIQIYGASTLSLQGISPKWILFYDLYENQKGQMYCKIANSIDFNFLKNNTNKYILNKFNIYAAQKKNPYYQKVVKKVPTLVFLNILNDYQRRYFDDHKEVQFLKKFAINFYEDVNEVQFYFQKSTSSIVQKYSSFLFNQLAGTMTKLLRLKNFRESTQPKQVIQGYLKQIQAKINTPFRYNYVGPIYIDLQNGFDLIKIDFKVNEHVYKVFAQDSYAQYIHYYCHMFGVCQRFKEFLIFRIIQEQDRERFQKTLDALISNFKQSGANIKYTHQLQDRRKKIPQTKLFMYFWAGTREKDIILLNYQGNPNLESRQNFIQQMIQCLQSDRLRRLGRQNKLSGLGFTPTKKRNGINCFCRRNNVDEIELLDILQEYYKNQYLTYTFQLPKSIKMFREPDLQLSSKSQREWESQITKLLKNSGIQQDKVAVRAWGKSFHKKDSKLSKLQENLKVQWNAQIRSYEMKQLNRFKQQYDKKEGVIGTQKVHMKFLFQHIAVVTTQNAFKALQDEFQEKMEYTNAENPRVQVEHFIKTTKKSTKVFIKIRGQNRDQLIAPSMRFVSLFTPKLVPLTEKQFRFLQRLDEGNQLLEEIERQYNYSIYFAFQKKTFTLKVYCGQSPLQKIVEKIHKRFEEFTCFQEEMEYRGKNLNRVKEIIQRKMQNIRLAKNDKQFLNYEILFRFRKVRLIGDLVSCDQVKNEIMKLVSKQKQQCQICVGIIQKPYRLYVCRHEFCWLCLGQYIRQAIKSNSKDLLVCPACPLLISVYDVQKIMSQQQFNKLCDIQISRYIQKNQDYHPCFSPGCQNIFVKKQSEKAKCFECDLCGKWYCLECKQSHIGFNCEDWKQQLNLNLSKLGIKKCPSCGEGIQKNEGCQHMECIKCHAHICWKCLKTFKTSKECYDHLAKECGGIFAQNR